MNYAEHYAEAESLLGGVGVALTDAIDSKRPDDGRQNAMLLIAKAQVHATLAQAEATRTANARAYLTTGSKS